MTILVTGGAGFIGSHVVDAIIAGGDNAVIIDDLSSGKKENLNPDATFYEMSITDAAGVAKVFEEHNIDRIVHLAAQIDARKSVEDPRFDADSNIMGSLNLFEEARKHDVTKIVFSSTGGVMYGQTDERPTPETHPENPESPYAISKLAVDKYLYFYRTVHNLPSVSLRFANVYGPRQNPHGEAGVSAIFINKMMNGDQPVINGDGETTRDYVYIDDVVSAIMLALTKDDMEGIYNVGVGREISVNFIFEQLNSHFDNAFASEHGPAKPEQRSSALSAEKIRSEHGWEPTIEFEEGLKRTVEWFKARS